jgi:hypothetical protein
MIKRYLFFMTPMCPNCSEIHEFLETVKMPGDEIDATEEAGMELSQKFDVMSVPTMIFIGEDGREQSRATNITEVQRVLGNKSLLDL